MSQKSKSLTVPKDLGLKVVSKERMFWLGCKERGEIQIKESKDALKLQEALMETVINKLKTC